jgi:serine/threonine protein kinase
VYPLTETQIQIGPFTLDHVIAEGGMGQVWRGIHTSSGQPIALKVLTSRMAQRPQFQQTFRNEARAMSRLDHPNIVRIFEFGQIESGSQAESYFGPGSPFIAMEFVDGPVAHHQQLSDWNAIQACLVSLLDALAHAHARGVVHRDLKPNNLLLTQDGILKLSDFGIAFATDDGGLDMERLRAAGTPEYMSPEQCHGQWRDFGPWTDLYAVGCVAYTLACGHPPFEEEHPMGNHSSPIRTPPETSLLPLQVQG